MSLPDLKSEFLILDGGMGTMLQARGLPAGAQPELWNLTHPDEIGAVQREYVRAGSQVLYTNTFGANALKLKGSGVSVREVIKSAVDIARRASDGKAFVALDIGPLGALLEPMGQLTFEQAYDLFAEIAEAGAEAGADIAVIETMTDLYETKAALLAVKEKTSMPVFVTMSFEESGRTFTGCTVQSMARTLEGLGADAIGVNCSVGPDRMRPVLEELCRATRLPVIAKPNAGLPDPVDGSYSMGPDEFAALVAALSDLGVTIFGGCCGTNPDYIRATVAALEGKKPAAREFDVCSFVCTPVNPVRIDGVRVIGERINPTGKKRFQQALLENDMEYILDVAVQQEDAGADILDVNVGYPGVDEVEMLPRVVKKLQSVVSLPLQLDSSNPDALEAALRVYNGKPAVNSVNGNGEVLARVLPIVKRYGAAVVGLTLDENGIPPTAEGRVRIAERILDAARACGIPDEDLWIDCLTLTVSAQQEQARETLVAVHEVRHRLGLQTVLGVSNISFGLPNRALVTQVFLTQAMANGLTLPIINPNQTEMLDAVAAHRVLSSEDAGSNQYIARFAAQPKAAPEQQASGGEMLTLQQAVMRGLKGDAARIAKEMLSETQPLMLVQEHLIPALDRVGEDYEKGVFFLPQLLSAAQAAQAVFEVIRAAIAESGGESVKKDKLLIATVRGDVHDIGKNIVRTVLENYGYDVIDLGRDVPPETIRDTVVREQVRLVGLSALMTTTLPAMEETIRLLHTLPDPPRIMVGGAVVTPDYAAHMQADYYARDARQAVEIAKEVLG